MSLKLKDARSLFFKIRGYCQVIVRNHAYKDYPERGFSQREILSLVRKGKGLFTVNGSEVAIKNSFLFFPKDDLDRKCKLVVLIEMIEIESRNSKYGIIVCSAYREVTDEV